MKRLNIFLLKSYIGPLLLTFFIGIAVLLMQFLWKYIDDLVGKGLDFLTISKFIFYACWTFVPMALPLAVLLSSLMFFGNMGERYELVALKAAGIPLKTSMRPIAFVCILVCGLAFFFANNAVPRAYLNYRTLYHEIRAKKPSLNIPEGVYYKDLEGYTIWVGKKHRNGQDLENVQVYDHSASKGNTNITLAKTGLMQTSKDGKHLVLSLFDGYTYGEDSEMKGGVGSERKEDVKLPFTRVKFEKQVLIFDLSSFQLQEASSQIYERHQKTLSLKDLSLQLDTLYKSLDERGTAISLSKAAGFRNYAKFYSGDSLLYVAKAQDLEVENGAYEAWKSNLQNTTVLKAASRAETNLSDARYYKDDIYYRSSNVFSYEVEWHKKFSLSVACLVLFFIGAPLGAIIRKGGLGMPVVVSILLFIVYHVLTVIGEKSAIEGVMSCFWGMWLAPMVFLPFGILLTVQATIDSSLLDADTWQRVWIKSFKKNGNKTK